MSKVKSAYLCQSCGYSTMQWLGKCPKCNQWNSFEEEIISKNRKIHKNPNEIEKIPKTIDEIELNHISRMKTGVSEFDRVMGGGLVTGSLTLIGGQPGIGKSTLLIELMGRLAKQYGERKILYVSGEESEGQIARRAKRLGINDKNLYILNENSWEKIKEHLDTIKPSFFVLDSIQTTVSEEVSSPPGTISQIREVTYEVMNYAKGKDVTSFVIGHITKDGNIAGPKILEHMVDCVVYFEGDQFGHYRILRAIKNRFGSTNEIGVFEMSEKGLREVKNPSQYFLEDHLGSTSGRSLTCILEGTRPLFVEIQALVVESNCGNPRRITQGIDQNRLSMMIAIIEKYFKIPISFNDIYINIISGIKLNKRESDLAIIASIMSSFNNETIDGRTIYLGEVGLTGEVRSVSHIESRLSEIEQLGYGRVITSDKISKEYAHLYKGLEIIGLKQASEIQEFR